MRGRLTMALLVVLVMTGCVAFTGVVMALAMAAGAWELW